MAPVIPTHTRYIPKDTESQSSLTDSVTVLRIADGESFVACPIPGTKTKDPKKDTVTTPLAPAIIPTAQIPLSRILNHPNIISLVDIVQSRSLPGKNDHYKYGDLTIFEDMDAGCLSYLLPSSNALPDFDDAVGWHALAAQNYQRFSLPESLCWHVLRSISSALLWLHHGIKETEGIPGDYMKHDDDQQPILIRDISPGQVWFKKPRKEETYGECKLGGFQWAKVTGVVGGRTAITDRVEDASREKKFYWAPVYRHTHPWSRPSEIWSLGAVIYTMMTGIPPPRFFNFNWNISRMNDKGFSQPLRELVACMLEIDAASRPDALTLIGDAQEGWRKWRVNSIEGRAYVDLKDKYVKAEYEGTRLGRKYVSTN